MMPKGQKILALHTPSNLFCWLKKLALLSIRFRGPCLTKEAGLPHRRALCSQQVPRNATLNPREMTAVSQGYSRNGQKGLFPALELQQGPMDANPPTPPVWRHRAMAFDPEVSA